MLLFSNAKINLGLRVLSKRPDGYHDIETVMVPVGLCDLLEFVENTKTETAFTNTGIQLDCSLDNNLIIKAFKLLKTEFNIPDLKIHLHKKIPPGTGLGGGSSNAAFMLKGLNNYFKLGMDDTTLENYAVLLGSDCPFFIRNTPCLATGRGEVLSEISLPGIFHLVLIYPGFPVSTRDAYDGIIPGPNETSLVAVLQEDPAKWKNRLVNDFETVAFSKHPGLAKIKEKLYESGAFYASMTGSGSVMYGMFMDKPVLNKELEEMKIWEGMI